MISHKHKQLIIMIGILIVIIFAYIGGFIVFFAYKGVRSGFKRIKIAKNP